MKTKHNQLIKSAVTLFAAVLLFELAFVLGRIGPDNWIRVVSAVTLFILGFFLAFMLLIKFLFKIGEWIW